MAIDYSGFKYGKGTPRVAAKREKKLDLAADERACRKKVDQRDRRQCFFPGCKVRANEKHHILSSSVRGQRIWQTDDIVSACTEHHRWFKAGLISVAGNPDKGPVTVMLTRLGLVNGIKVPARAVDNNSTRPVDSPVKERPHGQSTRKAAAGARRRA